MKRKINNFCLFASILLLFSCINETKKGFSLQKFSVSNTNLQVVIDDLSTKIKQSKMDDYELVLELNKYDSIPEFWFMYTKKSLANYRIFNSNMRVVGYLDNKNMDMLLLSNINNKTDFESFFYSFIKPSNKTKTFSYIFFPDWQYSADEKGLGYPPGFVDYRYLFYIFKNNKFEQVESESWINDRMSR